MNSTNPHTNPHNKSQASRRYMLDQKHLWHPFTSAQSMKNQDYPIVSRAQGSYFWDESGRSYLDATSSWWCINLGHSHPKILDAIRTQLDSLQHIMLAGLSHPTIIELSQKLSGLTSLERAFYASDGASAVECALRMAREYHVLGGEHQRTQFLSLQGGYHGDTLGAVSVGYVAHFHQALKPLLSSHLQTQAPTTATKPENISQEAYEASCLAMLEANFEKHHQCLAGVIVEPLCQGASGVHFYSSSFLSAIGKLCKQYGVLLIVDEIAVGYGRLGTMLASSQADVEADIVVLGKGMTGGYLPLSAVMSKERIYQRFCEGTFFYGHTFTGNPLAASAALATLSVYEEEKILQRLDDKAVFLKDLIVSLADLIQNRTGCEPIHTHHLGMAAALYLPKMLGSQSADVYARAIFEAASKRGVWIRPLGRTLYLWPPLNASHEDLVLLASVLRDAIESIG